MSQNFTSMLTSYTANYPWVAILRKFALPSIKKIYRCRDDSPAFSTMCEESMNSDDGQN